MDLNLKIKELSDAIKETHEYANLKSAKELIDKNKTLKEELGSFNKKQKDLISGRFTKSEADLVSAELKKSYDRLMDKVEVERFMNSMKQFNDLMGKVYGRIDELLNLNINPR